MLFFSKADYTDINYHWRSRGGTHRNTVLLHPSSRSLCEHIHARRLSRARDLPQLPYSHIERWFSSGVIPPHHHWSPLRGSAPEGVYLLPPHLWTRLPGRAPPGLGALCLPWLPGSARSCYRQLPPPHKNPLSAAEQPELLHSVCDRPAGKLNSSVCPPAAASPLCGEPPQPCHRGRVALGSGKGTRACNAQAMPDKSRCRHKLKTKMI